MLNILFLGDVYGKPGRKVIKDKLPEFRKTHNIDFVVANGENMAGNRGITAQTIQEIREAGVDVVTLGNHTWSNDGHIDVVGVNPKVLRPANYPPGCAGEGFHVYEHNGKRIGVLNLMGRVFMENNLDCPFQYSRKLMKEYRIGEDYDALIIDMHGEVASEKLAMAYVWDGRASLVVGSHTHVPTADTRIYPKGTGFQTDAGMCGYYESNIGATYESSLIPFEKKERFRFEVAIGSGTMCGVLAKLNAKGLCEHIEPVRIGGILSQTHK
jgi:metallophosphoesterase (TIGR00282 family)